jgi:hypothetical protein
VSFGWPPLSASSCLVLLARWADFAGCAFASFGWPCCGCREVDVRNLSLGAAHKSLANALGLLEAKKPPVAADVPAPVAADVPVAPDVPAKVDLRRLECFGDLELAQGPLADPVYVPIKLREGLESLAARVRLNCWCKLVCKRRCT